MEPGLNRRTLLKAPLGASATALQGQSAAAKESIMVLWFAHNIASAPSMGLRVDERYVGDLLGRCADHGFRTVFWVPRYVGKALYHSKVVSLFDSMYTKDGNSMAGVLARFDPWDAAVREAGRRGVRLFAQISIFDTWFPGLEDRYYERHPENLLVDRKQQLYFQGIPCYAEEGAREYCLREVRELIERGAQGVSFDMDSHQIGFWPPGYGEKRPDTFGYNAPVVEEYRKRYGVDILREDFDKAKWYALHGEFFTRFLRMVKEEIGSRPLVVGVPAEGFLGLGANSARVATLGYVSQAPALRIDFDWRNWLAEGIVDAIRVYAAEPYAVEVTEAMKRLAPRGRVYFSAASGTVDGIPDTRRQIARIRSGTLDGYIVHEEAHLEREPRLWEAFA